LSAGADGWLYGTNTFGGPADAGTVYRITTDGVFALLHTFDIANGKWPHGAPASGSDGAAYGTTSRGGASNAGTVYKVTPDGTFQLLHEFNGFDGEQPLSSLVMGPGGDLYGVSPGTTASPNRGTVFKVTSSAVVVLHTFTGPDGADAWGPLVAGTGALFGISRNGGANNQGTIFSITPAGAFETLHAFSNETGHDFPLMMASDGALYGTTRVGGPADGGVVFRLTVATADTTPPTVVAHATTASNAAGWYNSDVVVTFTCSDEGGAGIPSGACPADQVLSGEGDAVASTSVTVTDAAGNVSVPSNVIVVRIDRTAPTLAPVVGPAPVFLNGAATASATAADALAGVEHVTCDAVATNSVGTKSVTCSAVDRAGNSASAAATYAVVYRFDGFEQPVNDPANPSCGGCPRSVFKAGSTVAAIVRLKDASGAIVHSAAPPQWLTPVLIGSSTANTNEVVLNLPGMSGTSYQQFGPLYGYLWKTPKSHRTVWRIGVSLDDGQTYTVDIALR
jgi:uncharacterized repeat protein (TIGR03803 family)